jgi:pimeloyl-ACP methyl ester carboxylesterase
MIRYTNQSVGANQEDRGVPTGERVFRGSSGRARPASPWFLPLEWPRAAWEAAWGFASLPLLRAAPRGDGHPVFVLPGFAADDGSTRFLREYLRDRGYSAHGWRLGRNLGMHGEVGGRIRARLDELYSRHRRKLSLIGWSLGGLFARELAKLEPERVRQVITLASPFGGEARGHAPGWLHETVYGEEIPDETRAWLNSLVAPPPVPSTAIYSRSDGIVNWRACRELPAPHTDNIEIVGSHCGLGFHPLVLYAIADRLAQRDGEWNAFDRSGWRSALYR